MGAARALQHERFPPGREVDKAADLVAEYLETIWSSPCFDCWEEFPEQVHPYTLAAIYGGLGAHSKFSDKDHRLTQDAIRDQLLGKWVTGEHFVKFQGQPQVDASLLGLSTPYRVFDPQDELIKVTVDEIEKTLLCRGGVHRYPADTYFGGGEWLLLSAWLGWYHTEIGGEVALSKARRLLEWVESHFLDKGMPEQVPINLNDACYYQVWVNRWGDIALPLLWSHANHIILVKKLEIAVGQG